MCTYTKKKKKMPQPRKRKKILILIFLLTTIKLVLLLCNTSFIFGHWMQFKSSWFFINICNFMAGLSGLQKTTWWHGITLPTKSNWCMKIWIEKWVLYIIVTIICERNHSWTIEDQQWEILIQQLQGANTMQFLSTSSNKTKLT